MNHRLSKGGLFTACTLLVFILLLTAGGKPNPGTKADKRLKENNPDAGKAGKSGAKKPFPGAAAPFKKKGGK